jgi:hypothetical protein
MNQKFKETVGGSAGELLLSLVINPKVYDHVHESLPLASDLSNINPELTFTASLRRT